MRTFISSLSAFIVTAAIAVPTVAAQSSKASQPDQIVVDAKTPSAHAEAARQFRARAADLNAKAVRHEAEAKRLYSNRFPVEHKQTAMANNAWNRERQAAIDARRGAREAAEQAALHSDLAVELLAAR